MSERSVTVFSDRGRDILAFTRNHNGHAAAHGYLLARCIAKVMEHLTVAGHEVNAGTVAPVVLARLITVTAPPHVSDVFEIIHVDDVLEPRECIFRVDLDGPEVVVIHEGLEGEELFAGSLAEFEEYCHG